MCSDEILAEKANRAMVVHSTLAGLAHGRLEAGGAPAHGQQDYIE